jgi:hypothetical protein
MQRNAAGDAYHFAIDNPSPLRLIITRPVIDPVPSAVDHSERGLESRRLVRALRRPSRVAVDEARNAESTRPEIVKIVHTPITSRSRASRCKFDLLHEASRPRRLRFAPCKYA